MTTKTMTTKTNNEWEKEFDAIFPENLGDIDVCESDVALNNKIKSFIQEVLSSERQRLREKIEKAQIGWYNEGEGLDIEFSAQEMKDDILKLLG